MGLQFTNGAAWYPIYGGMQDWNYIYGGCFELTLEISNDEWPIAKELPTIWEYNRLSMLNLVASLVKTGIHGRILSSETGKPLPASLEIKGINSTAAYNFEDSQKPMQMKKANEAWKKYKCKLRVFDRK